MDVSDLRYKDCVLPDEEGSGEKEGKEWSNSVFWYHPVFQRKSYQKDWILHSFQHTGQRRS